MRKEKIILPVTDRTNLIVPIHEQNRRRKVNLQRTNKALKRQAAERESYEKELANFKPETWLIKQSDKPSPSSPQSQSIQPSPWREWASWLLEKKSAKLKAKDRAFLEEMVQFRGQPSDAQIWRIDRIYAAKGPRMVRAWRASDEPE